MAKFCTNCGKELVNGKCPNCGSKPATNNSQKTFGEMLKEYWELVKKALSKPMTIVKENNSEDKFGIGLISICVTGILAGIFMCIMAEKLTSLFSFLAFGISGFGSADIPYVQLFFTGFITVAGTIAIEALVAYVVFAKMFKADTSVKKMFVLFGLANIVQSFAFAGCSILAFFELSEFVVYMLALLFSLGSILSTVYIIKGFDHYAKIDSDKLGYAYSIVYIGTIIAVYLIAKNVLPSILG